MRFAHQEEKKYITIQETHSAAALLHALSKEIYKKIGNKMVCMTECYLKINKTGALEQMFLEVLDFVGINNAYI